MAGGEVKKDPEEFSSVERVKRVKRTLTDAERIRMAALRSQIDAEKEGIIAEARCHKAAHDASAKADVTLRAYNNATPASVDEKGG